MRAPSVLAAIVFLAASVAAEDFRGPGAKFKQGAGAGDGAAGQAVRPTADTDVPVYPPEPECTREDRLFQGIYNSQHNKKDLATSAQMVYNAARPQFVWTAKEDGDHHKLSDPRGYAGVSRRMACYEFVHFAAYFAGRQPMREVFDTPRWPNPDDATRAYQVKMDERFEQINKTLLDSPEQANQVLRQAGFRVRPAVQMDSADEAVIPMLKEWIQNEDMRSSIGTIKEWDRSSEIPAGKVVVGIFRITSFNNKTGYYHVGISLGGGNVINLGSDKNLNIAQTDDVFPRAGYKHVIYGDYDWDRQPRDNHFPPRPFNYCAPVAIR